ncbi:MAG: low molecular weight phosphotyrosine protein phosphatase [Sphingobacteriia bacterium]|nr:MAG: low molecular weight phosphotyrosine protein phosphatase [Sphingobacteriia bacterium]
MKILMVCLGNICRSPMAEGILSKKTKQNNLNWIVESAGTAEYHVGEAPHHLSQKVSLLHGIDISQQKCRQFKAADMNHFDHIYAMDQSNYANIRKICDTNWNEKKVDLILNELFPFENKEVPDPWYGGEEGFHEVFELLNKACDKIIEKFK